MKIGDLVKPVISCGGRLDNPRCSSAVILGIEVRTEWTEVDMFHYEDVEFEEYQLLCSCGTFEEDGNMLEAFNEGR